jgi:hypothetical protein
MSYKLAMFVVHDAESSSVVIYERTGLRKNIKILFLWLDTQNFYDIICTRKV